MYKIIILISLFTVSVAAYANQEREWIRQLEHPKNKQDELKYGNFLLKYIHYDFSTLFTPRSDFFGYIGKNYRRLQIVFTSITKSPVNNTKYLVKGISIASGNKCNFSGMLEIKQIHEFKNIHYDADDMPKNEEAQSQGLLLANYELDENPTQKYSGVFKGVMILYWYVDKDGILKSDIYVSSGRFINNQYIGSWTEYGKKVGKVANWGEHRVPFPGDLDTGENVFHVNPKYKSHGWEDYLPLDE